MKRCTIIVSLSALLICGEGQRPALAGTPGRPLGDDAHQRAQVADMFLYAAPTGKMKDATVFWHGGRYYVFCMYAKKRTGNDLTDYRNVWSAESDDGVHWRDVGAVIEDAPFPIWAMGVHRAGGRFVMNHGSFGAEGNQNVIRFWESPDLRTWTYTGEPRDLYPDARWYDRQSRLDCMTVLPVQERGRTVYYGYATGPGGFLRSEDGLSWEGLPPPRIDWDGLRPPMADDEGMLEIGGAECVNGRYYLVGGWFNMLGMSGYGTYTLVGESPVGPFRPDPAAYRLCGNSLRWVALWARFCRTDRDVLINGYVYDGYSYENGRTYLPPLKRAVADDGGHLRLGYWEGNDALKGDPLDLAAANVLLRHGAAPPEHRGASVRLCAGPEVNSFARVNVPSAIAVFDLALSAEQGLVIEGTLQASSQTPRVTAPGVGLFLEETPEAGTAILLEGTGRTCIGAVRLGERLSFEWEDVTGPGCASVKGMTPGRRHTFRLLLRGNLFEMYLDDLLVQTFNTTHTPDASGRTPQHLGLLVQNGTGVLDDLRAWRMRL